MEGALISLKDTFENNKSFTQENDIINYMICKILKISQDVNLPATLRSAASPLFSQVTEVTGTYAGNQRTPTIDEPPDDRRNDPQQPRRSERIRMNNLRR